MTFMPEACTAISPAREKFKFDNYYIDKIIFFVITNKILSTIKMKLFLHKLRH